ncbi:hypothetical protein ACFFHH_01295 [Cytobacillus solani]|nr:hypothetical protein [Cytobacillus solani]
MSKKVFNISFLVNLILCMRMKQYMTLKTLMKIKTSYYTFL